MERISDFLKRKEAMERVRDYLDRGLMALYPDQVHDLVFSVMNAVMDNCHSGDTKAIIGLSLTWTGIDRFRFVINYEADNPCDAVDVLDICIPEDRSKQNQDDDYDYDI